MAKISVGMPKRSVIFACMFFWKKHSLIACSMAVKFCSCCDSNKLLKKSRKVTWRTFQGLHCWTPGSWITWIFLQWNCYYDKFSLHYCLLIRFYDLQTLYFAKHLVFRQAWKLGNINCQSNFVSTSCRIKMTYSVNFALSLEFFVPFYLKFFAYSLYIGQKDKAC